LCAEIPPKAGLVTHRRVVQVSRSPEFYIDTTSLNERGTVESLLSQLLMDVTAWWAASLDDNKPPG